MIEIVNPAASNQQITRRVHEADVGNMPAIALSIGFAVGAMGIQIVINTYFLSS